MPTPDQFIEGLAEMPGGEVVVKPPRRRRRRWPWVLLVIMVLLLGGAAAYGVIIISNVAKITTNPLDFSGLAADATGRTNILLLGNGDPGHAGEQLTDTIMLLSLDSRTNQVAQVSLPRDLRVDIAGYGFAKINSANVRGGVELTRQTVADTLGIPIHYYVQTNFSGMKGLVDAVGGLDIDVKERLVDADYPCEDNQYKACGLRIEPGLQHMDGARALQYARCRKGTCGNDFGRAARQQEVIGLLRAKLVRWDILLNPTKLAPITAALHNTLETDMGAVQMLLFAQGWQTAGQHHEPIRLVLHTGNGGYLRNGGGSDLVPVDGDFEAIASRVQHIFTIPPQDTDLPD